jgi:hypothetical protein
MDRSLAISMDRSLAISMDLALAISIDPSLAISMEREPFRRAFVPASSIARASSWLDRHR